MLKEKMTEAEEKAYFVRRVKNRKNRWCPIPEKRPRLHTGEKKKWWWNEENAEAA